MPQPALLLFIQHPPQSDSGAYEAAMAHLRGITQDFGGEKFLFYAGYPNWNDAWNINMYRKRVQQGDSAGERGAAAFEAALEEGHDRILLLSGDCATLHEPAIQAAFVLLDTYDAVMSGAADGSCRLFGLRSPAAASLTAALAQSNGSYIQVLAAIHRCGLSCFEWNPEPEND